MKSEAGPGTGCAGMELDELGSDVPDVLGEAVLDELLVLVLVGAHVDGVVAGGRTRLEVDHHRSTLSSSSSSGRPLLSLLLPAYRLPSLESGLGRRRLYILRVYSGVALSPRAANKAARGEAALQQTAGRGAEGLCGNETGEGQTGAGI